MRVRDSIISSHNRGVKNQIANYHLNHVDINAFTVTNGARDFNKDRLYPSQTPKMLVVGLLEHDAFNGHMSKNPINFQHVDEQNWHLSRW